MKIKSKFLTMDNMKLVDSIDEKTTKRMLASE